MYIYIYIHYLYVVDILYDDVSIAKPAALVFAEKLDLRHDLVPEKGHNNALTLVHSFTCESTTAFFGIMQQMQ